MKRLTLAVSPQVRERLDRLRDDTGADTLTEVIRRSLAVYELMWDQTREGETVIIRDADGQETPIEFLWA